ncbi:hypothetical protein HPP92_001786 [Vanilla planifolia]|uniref:Uncharacterized protein n=1 Tax=Vanilla planifolia TaxID=51239 RepID=A0A835VHD4_VANPL|nr:hypothetical protein HPP92_001786 [Vanilla planifolia]
MPRFGYLTPSNGLFLLLYIPSFPVFPPSNSLLCADSRSRGRRIRRPEDGIQEQGELLRLSFFSTPALLNSKAPLSSRISPLLATTPAMPISQMITPEASSWWMEPPSESCLRWGEFRCCGNTRGTRRRICRALPPATTPTATATIGGNRCRRAPHRRSSRWLNPRRVLIFFATLSSMGTLVLLYFTLSMAKVTGGDANAR